MSIVYLSEDSLKTRLNGKMSKKRKTRNQKVLADQRHILYHLDLPAQPSYPIEKKPSLQSLISEDIQRPTYAYVLSDVKKTSLITFSIIFMQVILFFLMKKI